MRTSSGEPCFAPHPLALMCAALAAGIAYAHFFPTRLSIFISLAAIALGLLVLSLRRRSATFSTALVLVATLFAGAVLERTDQRIPPENQIKRLLQEGKINPGETVEIVGILDRPLEYTPNGFYLTLQIERLRRKEVEQSATGVVQLLVSNRGLTATDESFGLSFGTRVRLVTVLERADNYRNPGVSSLTEYLDRKGFDATGKLKSPALIESLGDTRIFVPLRWLYEWRRRLEREIHKSFSADTAGVLDAALLGNRYFLSRQSAERFREGGTFHVLVISGLHISFIGGVVLLIAHRLTRKRSVQFVVAASVLWSYTLAVGAEASVVRSALMFSLVAFAPVVSRTASSLNALGGAGLILLVWRADDLFDPSFQLTFLSVLAIVVIAIPLVRNLTRIGAWRPTRGTPYPPHCSEWLRVLSEALYWGERQWQKEIANSNYAYRLFKTPVAGWLERHRVQKLLRHATTALIVSASVQVSLLPLLIIYFHRLSASSLFLNIFVSGLMALLSVVALTALCVAQVSQMLAAPLCAVANGLNWIMVHSVDVFAAFGSHSLRLPEYSGWSAALYAVYYVPLVILVWRLGKWNPLNQPGSFGRVTSRRTRVLLASHSILFVLLITHPFSEKLSPRNLRVDFLDVGQGDAALVTMPDGTTLLIDGGGRPNFGAASKTSLGEGPPFESDSRSIGEAVVSEYLWWRGLDSIDYIVATHADADHIDGLNDVVNKFRVGTALVARTPAADQEYLKFEETLNREHTPANLIGAGDMLVFGDIRVSVLWPVLTDSPVAESRNNDSVVLRLEFGSRAFLMTGDIEKETEAALLRSGSNLSVDVVKVPHHGSKTSSTEGFVKATHPQLAVISVGLTSIFGHPRPEVVDRWKSAGAEVMTTGRKGTITVSTDGKDLQLETYVR